MTLLRIYGGKLPSADLTLVLPGGNQIDLIWAYQIGRFLLSRETDKEDRQAIRFRYVRRQKQAKTVPIKQGA